MENSMEIPQKTKKRVAMWSNNPTPGQISRQNSNSKNYKHSYVHSIIVYNSWDTETTLMYIDRQMDKEEVACIYVYMYIGILLSHKKEWNNAIYNNVDEPRDNHTKWSKLERWIPYVITYMWNLNYDTNELIYKTENRLMVAKEEGS